MTCPLDTIYPEKVGENLSQEEGTFACPSYPGRANVTFISLQNLRTVCIKKQNVYSAREKSYPPGRVTLLARPTFSTYTLLLAYPRIRGNTVKRRHQSMRTGAFVNSCSGKGKYFFITLAKVDSAREMTLFQDSFPKKKTGLSILSIETRPRP